MNAEKRVSFQCLLNRNECDHPLVFSILLLRLTEAFSVKEGSM